MAQVFDQFSILDPSRAEKQIEALVVISTDVGRIVKITQAAYDALTPKVATTLYLIVG